MSILWYVSTRRRSNKCHKLSSYGISWNYTFMCEYHVTYISQLPTESDTIPFTFEWTSQHRTYCIYQSSYLSTQVFTSCNLIKYTTKYEVCSKKYNYLLVYVVVCHIPCSSIIDTLHKPNPIAGSKKRSKSQAL